MAGSPNVWTCHIVYERDECYMSETHYARRTETAAEAMVTITRDGQSGLRANRRVTKRVCRQKPPIRAVKGWLSTRNERLSRKLHHSDKYNPYKSVIFVNGGYTHPSAVVRVARTINSRRRFVYGPLGYNVAAAGLGHLVFSAGAITDKNSRLAQCSEEPRTSYKLRKGLWAGGAPGNARPSIMDQLLPPRKPTLRMSFTVASEYGFLRCVGKMVDSVSMFRLVYYSTSFRGNGRSTTATDAPSPLQF
ncbi:hypothetical protein EVAR_35448_1 [Eumeta japonica]|uniref:Uncharacterized protein n=1 Tax=Eumeta variegata TaxID=151549 RepID=A0A4C1Z9R2_EUMVA|nr:hypothetical protein EVAR_35448_1 [Eumeta japonica]